MNTTIKGIKIENGRRFVRRANQHAKDNFSVLAVTLSLQSIYLNSFRSTVFYFISSKIEYLSAKSEINPTKTNLESNIGTNN